MIHNNGGVDYACEIFPLGGGVAFARRMYLVLA